MTNSTQPLPSLDLQFPKKDMSLCTNGSGLTSSQWRPELEEECSFWQKKKKRVRSGNF